MTDLAEWLRAEKPIHLVDVREPAEFEIVKIPGSVLVPKGEILSGNALASLPRTARSSSTARRASAAPRRWRR